MLITLSGLDGAGKSTLVRGLRAQLNARGRAVTVLHLNDDVGVYAVLRALRNAVRGAARPASPPGRARNRLRDALVWSKTLRRLLYPVDLVVFALVRFAVERLGGRVLIMDRYFYDTLVDVTNGRRGLWLRILERVTPAPDLAVLVDVRPETCVGRKPEYPLEYLEHRRRHYQTLFPRLPSGVTLANDDLPATQAMLERLVLERLEPRA